MKEITNEILFEKLKNLIETNQKEHAELIIQTTKTNGSVAQAFVQIAELKAKALELTSITREETIKELSVLQAWQNKWIGASIIISSVIIPILLYLLYLHLNP